MAPSTTLRTPRSTRRIPRTSPRTNRTAPRTDVHDRLDGPSDGDGSELEHRSLASCLACPRLAPRPTMVAARILVRPRGSGDHPLEVPWPDRVPSPPRMASHAAGRPLPAGGSARIAYSSEKTGAERLTTHELRAHINGSMYVVGHEEDAAMRWPFRRSKRFRDRVADRLLQVGTAIRAGLLRLSPSRSRRRARRPFRPFGLRSGGRR